MNLERPKVQYALWKESSAIGSALRTLELDDETHLDRVVAAVDIVAEKKVARVGRVAADLKQFHQVVVLTVDVAANCLNT